MYVCKYVLVMYVRKYVVVMYMYVRKYVVVMYVCKYVVVMYVCKYVVVMYMYVHKYVMLLLCMYASMLFFSQVVAAPQLEGSSDIPDYTMVECSLIPRHEMYTHREPGIFSHVIMT